MLCKICNKNTITKQTFLKGKGMCQSCANTRPKHYCVDCKKEVSKIKAKRCRSCFKKSMIGKKNHKYSCGINYCIDCKSEIENRKAIRCWSCYTEWAIGTNAPNYIDGGSERVYPKEFSKQLKEDVRERDNHECQICGMTEEEHISVYGFVLHVHHIDYNTNHNNKDNLLTTCLPCNIRANYNREHWQTVLTEQVTVKARK